MHRFGPRALPWRSLAIKLMIGLAVASLAVAYQDHFPALVTRGSGVVASAVDVASPVKRLAGHKGAVAAALFTDEGRTIVSAGADGRLKVWSAATGELQRLIELDEGAATALAVRDGQALTGHGDGRIVLWDLQRGDRIAALKHADAAVLAVAFSKDGTRLAASGADGRVAIWERSNPAVPLHALAGHDGAASGLAFIPGRPVLVSAGADRAIRFWNIDDGSLQRTHRRHRGAVAGIAVADDGRTLASIGSDGTLRVWSTASSQLLRTIGASGGEVRERSAKGEPPPPPDTRQLSTIAFARAPNLFAVGSDDGTVRLWDVKSGRSLKTYAARQSPVTRVDISPDGRRVAIAAADGTVRLWGTAAAAGE